MSAKMPSEAAQQCPVDHQTRSRWLEAAQNSPDRAPLAFTSNAHVRFSLDALSWQMAPEPSATRPRIRQLSTEREISTIPRAYHGRRGENPANHEAETGHLGGNWVYPSQDMFFNAMKRKGYSPQATDMASVVPIHNAVNEKAWAEIKGWEAGRGSESCGGPRLVSFRGDSSKLSPRALWNTWLMGYQKPFDRHDWVVDRCGQRVEYVIDFYSGHNNKEPGKGLNFYLDVRPKLNTLEGVRMRVGRFLKLE
ncbi:cytochrome C1 heme lyase [Piedraia hortae CBS 480.64]|uniref:Holocytochrome c-type synthase n=1 Tax=Piedraia hortae CBS 480.64 TaxID=1314780 RepID=A0A6A7C9B9_9PEZI|nr:cytochrome C1 heme lyase [Piedraia hortae CBS 480.64]